MDSYRLMEYLIKRNKKTVTRSEMERFTGFSRAEDLHACLEFLLDEGILSPMVKYGTNGNRSFPVFNKYHVRLPRKSPEEDRNILEEIRTLHPLMISNGYLLGHPEMFAEFQDALLAVNDFLFRNNEDMIRVSRKERSFELFDEEKFLEKGSNSRFTGLLDHLGIGPAELAFYDTPDRCFPDYIPQKKDDMTILICENKDIWFNIRRIMFEDHVRTIFGADFDGVLLGNGNQAAEKNKLTQYSAFLGVRSVKYLYWGDIDREGMAIYGKVCRANPSLQIRLFTAGYEKMMDLAEGRKIPDSKDHREHAGYEELIGIFDNVYEQKLQMYLKENKRLPQEIISYAALKSSCGCNEKRERNTL